MTTVTTMSNMTAFLSKALFFVFLLVILIFPYAFPQWMDIRSGLGLFLGLGLSLTLGNPYRSFSKKWASPILTYSVVGLGFGMNFMNLLQVGMSGIVYTVLTLALTFALGRILGHVLQNQGDTSFLITTGTAICGGSAIASVAPVLQARERDISLALGTVFVLNALALFLFPPLGQWLGLSQGEFGLWCALAIHDTSSVVGASLQFGEEALEVGTTVKMARALWIIPLTMVVAFIKAKGERQNERGNGQRPKSKRPWFILGLVLAAAVATWVPSFSPIGNILRDLAKHGTVVTLFLIGLNIQRSDLQALGWKSLLHGALLWLCMSALSLTGIVLKFIRL